MIGRVCGHTGKAVELTGHAYDFGHRVSAIEFSLDEGAHWSCYPTPGTTDYQTTMWHFTFTPPYEGLYRMLVRSINERGETSPEWATVELEIV